jgi:hypothetical protein
MTAQTHDCSKTKYGGITLALLPLATHPPGIKRNDHDAHKQDSTRQRYLASLLLMSQLATEAELMVQKPRQARRRVKDEAPPDPPADFTPGGPHSEEEEP